MILRLIDADIDNARGRLPKIKIGTPAAGEVKIGTPDARDIAAVERYLLLAKGRLKSIEKRDPAGSTDAWGR